MQRVAQRIDVPLSSLDEYVRLHEAVWPEVEEAITQAGICNYTIFREGEHLFAYFEIMDGTSHAEAVSTIERDPYTQQWWTLTDPLQRRMRGTPDGEQWLTLSEVWHLD